ncbi:MAG: ABC transporter ATP-binding protein/permease [Alphaproteobacteria bacterium]|nr:ABC transporter ATP-binding protein/permease [Alphaproteobacteria bacterium]
MADRRKRALAGRLWREYLKRYWRLLAILIPVVAVVGVSAGGYVYITQQAGDLLERGDARIIYQIPAWIIAITLVRAIAMYAQTILTSEIAQRVLRDLQGAMFKAIVKADYARFSREATGGLVSRFTYDINVIAETLVRSTSQVLRDVVVIIAVFAAMIRIDWVLGLGVIVILGLASGPLGSIARRARKQTKAAQAQMGDMTSLLQESFSGARLVRTYGLETYESDRAKVEFERRRKMQMRLTRNRARSDPILEALGGVAAAGVFAFIGWRVAHGEANTGDLLALITAIAAASASARALGTFNTVLNEGAAALERVFALLDEEPQIVDRPGAPPLRVSAGRIAFERVTFSYNTAGPAISDVDFVIAPGETVAVIGPSGAGKSTVLNLIPRLFDVTSGRVTIDGQDVRDVSLASLRSAIAVVSQDATLFNDTVRANIAFGRFGASDADIVAAARAAAAHEFIMDLPQGYDTIVGERGGLVSGGERQRLALARAFLRNAPILLLDEATSALDAESERKVQDALARLAKGRTTLVIAHRLATVRDADRIIAMQDGRIVEVGRHDELVAKGGLYARLARLQFGDGA